MIFIKLSRSILNPYQNSHLLLEKNYVSLVKRLSEVMTIVIAFHASGYRTFKEFYTFQVLPHWQSAFPQLVSYNRFVELMPWAMMLLCCFLHTRKGEITGISFIDSTPIEVCHPCRSKSHRVFEGKGRLGQKFCWLALWF